MLSAKTNKFKIGQDLILTDFFIIIIALFGLPQTALQYQQPICDR